jgi:hypothetical protein
MKVNVFLYISDSETTREFGEDHVDLHLSDGLVGIDHNPQDAELITDYDGSGDETHRVEADGAAHVSDEVVGSVPEEYTPEPSRDTSSRQVVVTSDGFSKFEVSILQELVLHAADLLLFTCETLSERHLSGHRSSFVSNLVKEVIKVICGVDLLGGRTGWLRHFGDLFREHDHHELIDNLDHIAFALLEDLVDLVFFHLFPVSRLTVFIFLELVIKLSNQSLVYVSERIVKLLSSKSVKADLVVAEKVELLNRFHQEAVSEDRGKVLVKAE